MIKQLKIKNYILIDELYANFHAGLNVITGETGAGKSILTMQSILHLPQGYQKKL